MTTEMLPVDEMAEAPVLYLSLDLGEPVTGDTVPAAQHRVWPCAAGAVVGRVKLEGEASTELPRVAMEKLSLGRHVAWNGDHTAVVAEKSGQIVLRHTVLSVEEKLEIPDDLDATAGYVNFPGEVAVHKSVLDLVHLQAQGNITVHGSIEAAMVIGEADIVVHHGICGKNHGRVEAKGSITARFASNARVIAGGDVHLHNELTNSHVHCGGRFLGERASVLSGEIIARREITCDTVGTEAGVHVLLSLGLSADEVAVAEKQVAQLSGLRKAAQHVKTMVEPLMRDPRRLTPQQKEKATELLYSASEAEERAATVERSLEGPRKRAAEMMEGAIVVRGMIYPGVTLRIGGVECVIRTAIRGPVRIVRDKGDAGPVLAIFDGHRRKMAPLACTHTADWCLLQVLGRADS